MGWRKCGSCNNFFNDTKSTSCPRCQGNTGEQATPEPKPKPKPEPEPEPEPEPKPEPKPKLEPELEPPQGPVSYARYLEHLVAHGKEAPLAESIGEVVEPEDGLYEALHTICGGVKMFDREHAVQAGIEQLYSHVRWTGRVAIVVYTEERQGFGDITLGLKTAQLFREGLGRTANHYEVAFIVDKRTREQMKDLGKGFGIEPIQLPAGDKFTAPEAEVRAQTFIRAPVLQARSRLEQLRHSDRLAPRDTTQDIGFTEYAKEEPDSVPSGLKAKELGIAIHHELRGYRLALEEREAIEQASFRQGFLAELPNDIVFNAVVCPPAPSEAELEKFVLGERSKPAGPFGVDLSRRSDTEGPRGQEIVLEQGRGSRLYFGYSNRSGTKFVKLLVAHEKASPDHICVVHPSRNYLEKYWPAFFDEIGGKYKDTLLAAKFGVVEVVEITKGAEATTVATKLVVIDEASPRSLRIVLANRVQPVDMLALFEASEPVAMVTGNQSTSEALSAGKTLIYECLSFAQNKQFMQDLFDLGQAAVDKGEAKQMQAFYQATLKLSEDIISGDKKVVPDSDCEAVAALLAEGQMAPLFHKLSAIACTTKDLRQRLLGIYIRDRLHRDGKLRGALADAESKLGRMNYKAKDFESFFAALREALAKL